MSDNSAIEWTDATWSPIRARVKENAHHIATLHGWTDLAEICQRMAGHVGPHCEFISSGCNHCYSCTNNHRCLPSNGTGLPFDKRSRELVDIFIDEKAIATPLHWKRPRKIFVENQSDLFGEWVPNEFIAAVFGIMAASFDHTFQVLTKRAERMRDWFKWIDSYGGIGCYIRTDEGRAALRGIIGNSSGARYETINGRRVRSAEDAWAQVMNAAACVGRGSPLSNVWLGVSVEDQKTADARIPFLIATPAAVRFISYEPALGPLDLEELPLGTLDDGENPGIDWVICGGESGHGARPFNLQWARDVVQQCKAANVPVFVKQLGANPFLKFERSINEEQRTASGGKLKISIQQFQIDTTIRLKDRKGGDMTEWPEDLRVREFPSTEVPA